MVKRRFTNSGNPGFSCSESVVVLPFGRRSYLPAIVSSLDGEEVELDETTDRQVFTLHGATGSLTLVYSGMGGPAVANALEMVAANGAREVVLFGACGGVDPRVAVGDLIVASGGVRGDGTSRYYAPAEFPAACDPLLTARLWQTARDTAKIAVHRGVVYTTDASYRQGPEIYQAYQGLIIGVECEVATAAVVGARLGLAVAALLFCTDNVTLPTEDEQTYRGLRNPDVQRGFDEGLAVLTSSLSAST
jgi:uridine phosphorylase